MARVCPTYPGKEYFRTRDEAIAAAAGAWDRTGDRRILHYECEDHWHIGHTRTGPTLAHEEILERLKQRRK
jgi:hypothetical protein